jgi:HEAT repeat protein
VTSYALFEQSFGDLVALLRTGPQDHAAQDRLLAHCTALVATRSAALASGVEILGQEDPRSLKSRLLARLVDTVQITAGAEAEELLHLARALSHDTAPVGSTAHVAVTLVPSVVPDAAAIREAIEVAASRSGGERRHSGDRRSPLGGARYRGPERRRGERRQVGERRLVLIKDQAADLVRFQSRFVDALRQGAWAPALQALHKVLETLPSVPVRDRRSHAIACRRLITPAAIEGFVDIALRDALDAPAAARVLRWIGLDSAEILLARMMESEATGPRRVLYEILGGMPDAFPLVLPYLSRGRWHEVRHAAEVLGRMGNADAIEPLKRKLADPDERVRVAVVAALAEFPLGEVADGLRIALASPSAKTRSAAAEAIGRRRVAAFAMPLLGLLAQERDAEAWRSEARALGAMQTSDAISGLVKVALARRAFLRGGYSVEQRLEAVQAIAQADGAAPRGALERLAREGDGPVRTEAARLLADRYRAAG